MVLDLGQVEVVEEARRFGRLVPVVEGVVLGLAHHVAAPTGRFVRPGARQAPRPVLVLLLAPLELFLALALLAPVHLFDLVLYHHVDHVRAFRQEALEQARVHADDLSEKNVK